MEKRRSFGKRFKVFAGIAVAMGVAASALAAERIVFIGDSITGQSRISAHGYANQLDDAYAATRVEADRPVVVALGGSGQTVESWRNVEFESRENATTTLDVPGVYVGPNLDQPTDRLVVLLGMNNVLAPSTADTPESIAAFKDNYYQLVTNLVRRTTALDLYLGSVPPCTEDPDGPKNLLIQKLNAKIQELVAELATDATCLAIQPALSVHYIPVWENQTNLLAVGRTLAPGFHVTSDTVHPNAAGHIGIARSFLDAFQHADASAWLVANRLQAQLDAAANGNAAGLSHVLRATGAGAAPGLYAFHLRANWVERPGESAPASASFSLALPRGWSETAAAATNGLSVDFTLEGPAEYAPTTLSVTATPASGAARTASVHVPAPWRVSTPVAVPWSNAGGHWAFLPENAACETEAAIEAGDDFAAIEAANAARTPSWQDYFPSVGYVGGDNSDSLDLSAVSTYPVFGAAYALRYVYAERATDASLSLSTAAFSGTLHTTVWLNGEEVLSTNATGVTAPVHLLAGNNVLAVRTAHLTWQWQVGVALAAEDNSFDLRYGLAPLEAVEEEGSPVAYEPEKTAVLPDGSVVYTFLSNGCFRTSIPGRADVFLVGGGGGGGGNYMETLTGGGQQVGGGYSVRAGGGGGGGGVLHKTGIDIAADTDYPVVVGAGGAQNQNGGPSSAFGFEAIGGGHGGRIGLNATSGASGGGAGAMNGSDSWTDGAAAAIVGGTTQGYAGGAGYSSAYNAPGYGGGGGGAGGAGGDATTSSFGAGGAGVPCPFLENSSGYGAGGNGGRGGYEVNDPVLNCGAPGADGYGQGGAGGSSYVHVSAGWGGAGGCGAVLVRFYPDTFDPEDFPNQPTVRVLPDGSLAYSFSTPGSGLFTPPSAGPVKVFLVGGGGGGGGCGIAKESLPRDAGVYASGGYLSRGGGGGGGGAVVSNDAVVVEKRPYVITVGAGGAQNENGGSSYAFGLQAIGGGAGAWQSASATAGGPGGGGNYNHPDGAEADGFFAGGTGVDAGNNVGYGGGGAGAGGAGGHAASSAGAGGAGVPCPYFDDGVLYGAGGAGGASGGQDSPYAKSGADGTPGTGAGGNGCNSWFHINAGAGGTGGSGMVILVCRVDDGYFHKEVIREASGGEKLAVRDGVKWMTHTYPTNGTFTAYEPMSVQALLVGGGGAGGKANNVRGGGGGAGGVLLLDEVLLLPGEYPVVVGAGGQAAGADGSPTTFNGFTALGGGGGGSAWSSAGRPGGSGGGGCGPYNISGSTVAGGAGDAAQGHGGGIGIWNGNDTNGKAGGGGGAGGAGGDATLGISGSGGDAIACAFLGEARYYAAGGGGGGVFSNSAGSGGMGGGAELGGHGGYYVSGSGSSAVLASGTDGTAGTGSGGGGEGGTANMNSGIGKGGSGIVIVRYKLRPNGLVFILR
ncbi:MAG: SGNH/GDSL hydrolase family protein [Kiritimatiellia bacterium]